MSAEPRRQASYDLHLHTYWSYDATAEPESHFRRARELGLRCIAITEHHVLDSQEEVQAVAKRYPDVRLIPAAELTVSTSIGAVDLLCYGFPAKQTAALEKLMATYHAWQQSRGEAVCRGMQAIGLDYTEAHRRELLKSYRPRKTLDVQGFTHVKNQIQRQYFLERGFVADPDDYRAVAIQAAKEAPLPRYPAVETVVPVVHEAGARVAIAHPFGYFQQDNEKRMDALREECALDGIECAHLSAPMEFTRKYRAYCARHGLFSCGGSDCHSDEDVQKLLGRHGGEEEWLDELLERLEA